MPVKKFRSVEEIPPPPRREPGSAELWRAIEETWAAATRLAPLRFPPGVYKQRSIEELNAQTEEWQRQNVKRLAERPRVTVQPGSARSFSSPRASGDMVPEGGAGSSGNGSAEKTPGDESPGYGAAALRA